MCLAATAVRLAALLCVGLVLSGCGGVTEQPEARAVAPEESPAKPQPPSPVERFRSPRKPPAVAPPVRIRIPAARVDSGLQRLRKASDGAIQVPSDPDVAGWYVEGPRPGQRGPAVILGHVDSRAGPAVFYKVPWLRRGDIIHIDRSDKTTANFRVTRVLRVPKSRFPSELVYAPTLDTSLRLVTCGGIFDRRTGSYRDNVIVFAAAA
jgi:Sortase domain